MKEITNSKPFSLGFIGGSVNSAVGYAHFVSCKMDNKFTVDAGCFSKDVSGNKVTAQSFGVNSDRIYTHWQDMLKAEKGQLDAIVILLPTPMHFDVVLACLNEGFSVICEKALTLKSSEAQKLLEVQNRTKGFLAVIYNYSGYPMIRELKNKIQKGELGTILHFQAEMPQEGYVRVDAHGNKPTPQQWRLTEDSIPKIHLDLAVHLHQLIHHLIDQKPFEVISDQGTSGSFPGVIDNVNCLCHYTGGIQGHIWFSKSALGHRNGLRLRIYGTKGSAEWFQACPEELIISYTDGRRELLDRAASVEIANMQRYNRFKAGHPAGFIEGFANLYYDIADCISQYRETGKWHSENVYGAELSIEGLQFFEAMVKSVETKTWQSINIEH
jgi:predicted dehydrogenase